MNSAWLSAEDATSRLEDLFSWLGFWSIQTLVQMRNECCTPSCVVSHVRQVTRSMLRVGQCLLRRYYGVNCWSAASKWSRFIQLASAVLERISKTSPCVNTCSTWLWWYFIGEYRLGTPRSCNSIRTDVLALYSGLQLDAWDCLEPQPCICGPTLPSVLPLLSPSLRPDHGPSALTAINLVPSSLLPETLFHSQSRDALMTFNVLNARASNGVALYYLEPLRRLSSFRILNDGWRGKRSHKSTLFLFRFPLWVCWIGR